MADLVQPATGLAYGVAARLNGNNGFNCAPRLCVRFRTECRGPIGTGEMVMYKINGLNVSDIGNDGPAVRLITLDLANKDYTLSLDIIGSTLYGTVTEVVADRLSPISKRPILSVPMPVGFRECLVSVPGARLCLSNFR